MLASPPSILPRIVLMVAPMRRALPVDRTDGD